MEQAAPQILRPLIGAILGGQAHTWSQFPQVLACPRRPDRHAVQHACQVHVTPDRAAHVMQPPTPLHMHAWTGFLPVVDTTPGCSLAHYTLFDVLGHARIRRAVADWTLSEVLADVLAILPDTVSVRVLTRVLPGLPPLQVVARPRHLPRPAQQRTFDSSSGLQKEQLLQLLSQYCGGATSRSLAECSCLTLLPTVVQHTASPCGGIWMRPPTNFGKRALLRFTAAPSARASPSTALSFLILFASVSKSAGPSRAIRGACSCLSLCGCWAPSIKRL